MDVGEASKELRAARHQAKVCNYDQRSLETVVGKHAALMVDFVEEKDEQKKQLIATNIGTLTNQWAQLLLGGYSRDEQQLEYEFRVLVQKMVSDFNEKAMSMLKNNSTQITETNEVNAIQIYMLISKKAGRHYEQTKRHLDQYLGYIYTLGRSTVGTENFMLAGVSCIWSGIRLGTYLDKIKV